MEKTKEARTFFGHPMGLLSLFSTEFCERFSYYGMRAILVYYIYAETAGGGLGLPKQTALYAMSLFGSSVYLLSIMGGWVADRVLGSYRSVFWGGVVIAAGHIILGVPTAGAGGMFAALCLIAIGTGLLKPNVSQMVGDLYPNETGRRRQAAFNIFVMGINLGSLLSPLIVGYAQRQSGYHAAFLIPAAFMFAALAIYRGTAGTMLASIPKQAANPLLPHERRRIAPALSIGVAAAALAVFALKSKGALTVESFSVIMPAVSLAVTVLLFVTMFRDKDVTESERGHIKAYIAVFVASTVFWAIEELQSSVFAVLADSRADNRIGDFLMPAAWYQSINPLVIVVLAPILAAAWTKLARQPSTISKICIGLLLTAVSFAVAGFGFLAAGVGAQISPLILIVPIVLFSAGEMFVSPIGLSVTTELAPAKYGSRMMAIWFLSNTVGQSINSFCVRFFDDDDPSMFFFGYALATAVVIVGLLFLAKRLTRLMES